MKRLRRAGYPVLPVAALAIGIGLGGAGCGGSPVGRILEDGDAVRLVDVQAQVFTPRCALSGCHVGAQAPFGLDLSAGLAGNSIVGVASAEVPALLRVRPYDASNSYLYMKVSGSPGISGDPMPLRGEPLSASDLTLIENWIEQGAR